MIAEIADQLEWSWRLIPRRAVTRAIDVRITLAAVAPDRTLVTIGVGGGAVGASFFGSRDRRLAKVAVGRLYDLVQTAATL